MKGLLLRDFDPDFLAADVKAEARLPDMTGLHACMPSIRLTLEMSRGNVPAAL